MRTNKMIVGLQLAKLTREKGFDEKTNFAYCYDTNAEGYYLNYDPDYFRNSTLWERHAAAPTREELQLWLQQNSIFVIVDVDQTLEPKFAYKVRLYKNGLWEKEDRCWSDLYYSYETALEDGLTEGLNKLK